MARKAVSVADHSRFIDSIEQASRRSSAQVIGREKA
jgi:hypothetical protein